MTEKPKEEEIIKAADAERKVLDRIVTMEKQLSEEKAARAKAERDLEALRKKRETKKPKEGEGLPPSTSSPYKPLVEEKHDEHGHEEGKPHYIGAWQHFCPTCGDPNPDFKDETICTDCGTHLGAKEVAEKLKACPNCGGHSAKVIK
jgi:predicted RNA-binding Zn-ribbon protein involved in translation (DUF1610 family)